MTITNVTLTPALAAWLRGAHDDGEPDLFVGTAHVRVSDATGICVLRADYSDLSPTEEREVRALLAAHEAEPLAMPTK